MSGSLAPSPPAELLSQLAGSVALASACIPVAARRADPELEPAARSLGLRTTLRPLGDEELLCLVADGVLGVALGELEAAVQRFEQLPFLLLLASESAPRSAVAAADAMLTTSSEWLAWIDPSGTGAALVSTERSFLALPTVPGEWRAAPVDGELGSEREALEALWRAVERDRRSLEDLAKRIDDDKQQLNEAHTVRERMSGEVARLRAAERREVDKLRLLMLEERAWVAEQAARLGESTSWRVGHRLVRTARRLTFRGDRGTDLPAKIVERMQDDDLR